MQQILSKNKIYMFSKAVQHSKIALTETFIKGILGGLGDLLGGGTRRSRQSVAEAAITSAARAIGSNLGRQIVRGVLGSILGGKR